jgi:hypothetical protein
MIETLIKVFFVLSLMFVPLTLEYYKGDAYSKDDPMAVKFMLGNLGHSESYCVHKYLKLKSETNIYCRKGVLSELKTYGLMPDPNLNKLTGTID